MTNEEAKQALKLAGKLALAAEGVVSAHVYDLSRAIIELATALNMYNHFIFNITESKE